MKKSATLIFTFIAAVLTVSAQYRTPKVKDSDWVAKPILHPAPREYNKEPAVVLTQSSKVEYKNEGKGTSIYHTFHRTVKLMDERGVAMYSTVGIPFYSAAKIEEIRARTISASGKVYEIPHHMFKESQDENGAPEIKFAMEGVGKNAEIEVYIKTILPYSRFGSEYFQSSIPIMNLTFEMAFPKEFIIEQKGYNGFPDMKDTLITGRRHMKVHQKDIPGLKSEPYSFIVPHLMRTEWRVSFWANDYGDEKRLFTWDEYAKTFYNNVFNIPDGRTPEKYWLTPKGQDLYRGDTERKAVNNFLNSIGVTGSERELDKILKIERGIKNNITVYPVTEDHSGRLDTIISKRSATAFGIMKLYAACFAQTDVKCEIGSTTNRMYHLFNSSFENWNNLYDYLIYFPNQKAYLAPTNVLLRYPMIPEEVLGNTGVFCKMSTPAEARPRVAEIRLLPTTTSLENCINLKANINFEKNMEPEMDMNYSYTGMEAVAVRNHFAAAINPERRKDYFETMVPGVEKSADIIQFDVANESLDSYFVKKPVLVSAKVKSNNLTEKAAGKILFKIGTLIGAQTELYENKDRKLPVDINYPFSHKYTFVINLPVGYKVLNLKSLRSKLEFYDADNKKIPACSFVSNYSIKGKKLTITVSEIFSQAHYHLSDFSNFRRVINATADFNKLSLILGR